MRRRTRKSRKKSKKPVQGPENSHQKLQRKREEIKKRADAAIAKIDAVVREAKAIRNLGERPIITLCDGRRVDIWKFSLR